MDTERKDGSKEKQNRAINFSDNFREVLRDTVLAHSAALIIFSVFFMLMLKNPDSMIKGLSIIFTFVIPLLAIAIWLTTSIFNGYRKMINSSLPRYVLIFFHIFFFEIITGFSVSQAAHVIAASVSSAH